MSIRRFVLACFAIAMLPSCADAPARRAASGSPMPDVARSLEITCRADGRTDVSTDAVLVQPDGVHITVHSRLDEAASVGPVDVDPGITRLVMSLAPGRRNLACYPYSRHDDHPAPDGPEVEILDPSGIWTSGELICEGDTSWSQISDYAAPGPPTYGPPPLAEARSAIDGIIEGLRATDEVAYQGYPDAPEAVLLIREGRVVGSFNLRGDRGGSTWDAVSLSACTEIQLRG